MRFRMAYAIQCHKNPNQLNRLIRVLQNDNVDFFIHVDKKSNIKDKIIKNKNIYIIENTVKVYWGHISQIEATLNIFKYINKIGKYSYIHLISGQDFPIKSNEYINKYFKDNYGLQYIQYRSIPTSNWAYNGLNRIKVFYPQFILKNKLIKKLIGSYEKIIMRYKIFQRKNLGYKFYGGSSWFSITGECLEYILKYLDENPQYLKFFKNTLCGDELFFQTLIVNSPYKNFIINDNKRYIVWKEGDSSPNIIIEKDYNEILKSDKIWARKFDERIDNKIITRIENTLLRG